jgi:MFS family permease
VIAVNGMLIVVTQPWAVPQFEKLGRYRVIPWAALVFGAGFAVHSLAHTALAHVGAIACWTLGEVALFPLCNAVVADLAPDHLRGRYQGAYWMAWMSANVVGPPLGLFALDHAGARGWGIGIVCAGIAAATALVGLRERMRKHVESTVTAAN